MSENTARIHNFSAGPAVLPESVIREAQRDLWAFGDSGLGIVECSHRSKLFDGIVASCQGRIRRLMKLDDDQAILFLQGGARTQFWQWPANILRGGRATYLDTGVWAESAIKDARRYGTVDVPFSSKKTGWDHVPAQGAWGPLPEGTVYFHYTSNNTVAGSEFHYVPEVGGGALLVCDMSSDILSRQVDGSRFDFIYAGAQKNLGPSGVTVCIVRKSLVDRMTPDLPEMVRYSEQIAKDSMLNTPCTFGIYMIERVTAWIEEQGLDAVEARNIQQAERLYTLIDESKLYRARVQEGSRSRMNVTFTTGDDDRDAAFVKGASAAGISGLKGHRSVGGLRASLYNAQTDQAVEALVDFMHRFEQSA
jgi:phosphoserine aminotransferase